MIQDKILYTDGHDVTITDSMFHVRNMSYRLQGITKHGLHIVKPHRLPGFILLLIGAALFAGGVLELFPINVLSRTEAFGIMLTGNAIMAGIGAGIILVSILVIGLLREKYAVRIATAEGEKDVVVSKQKEYVNQIVNALNRAFNFIRVKK